MKILLATIPSYSSNRAINLIRFPFGIAHIAAALIEDGYYPDIMEINAFRYPQEVVEEKIKGSRYDVVGISAMVDGYRYIQWLATTIKRYNPQTIVILGGVLATTTAELILKRSAIDVAVIGEGDYTIKELMAAIREGRDYRSIPGLAYLRNGEVTYSAPKRRIENLDVLPLLPYRLFPNETYIRNLAKDFPFNKLRRTYRPFSLLAGRGCPYHCIFCTNTLRGKTVLKSKEYLIEEIKYLQRSYDINAISFADEVMFLQKDKMYELCEAMIREKLNITWCCSSRVDKVDLPLLKIMKRAGCFYIIFGFESGSQKILNKIDKKIKVEDSKRVVELCRQAGLNCGGGFMVNIPGETRETIQATVDFFRETDLDGSDGGIGFIACPFPGTRLYQEAKAKGLIHDEEAFIEKIGRAGLLDVVVNFTSFSDAELLALKDEANIKIRINYYRRHPERLLLHLPVFIKRASRQTKEGGLSLLINTIGRKGSLFLKSTHSFR